MLIIFLDTSPLIELSNVHSLTIILSTVTSTTSASHSMTWGTSRSDSAETALLQPTNTNQKGDSNALRLGLDLGIGIPGLVIALPGAIYVCWRFADHTKRTNPQI